MDNPVKEEHKSIKHLLIVIFTVVIMMIAGTFAWLSFRSTKTAMSLVIGDINGLLVTLKPYQINGSITPVTVYSNGQVINVTADNKKTVEDDFRLFYRITSIATELKSTDFKYTVTKSTDGGSTYTVVKNGNFSSANDNSNLEVYKDTVPGNTTYLYKVYLWIDTSGGDQSSMQGKIFNGELRASISVSLYSMMRDEAVLDNVRSTYVNSDTGINWNAISSNTNGKGIYLHAPTKDDHYPVYYYRGAVTNNNVLFGGFCWKIVRTTNTGGVKLIYNGHPSGTNSNECTNTTDTDTQLTNTSAFNSNRESIAYVGYMYGTVYTQQYQTMTDITDTYMYGTAYDETNHQLVTTNAMSFSGTDWATYYNQLNNNHYTCFNSSGECDQVYYIIYTTSTVVSYIQIPTGKTINQVLDEMLTSSTNTTNSTIKTRIDNWYQENLINQEIQLEDTIWCNDRTIYNLAGFNPNGGSTTSALYFSPYGRTQDNPYTPSLACSVNDSFTLPGNPNGNGKLTYPVGLLTADEARLAGGKYNSANASYYLHTRQTWSTSSPYRYLAPTSSLSGTSGSMIFHIHQTTGGLIRSNILHAVNISLGVRPCISLKAGTKFVDGDGTSTKPYVVETEATMMA